MIKMDDLEHRMDFLAMHAPDREAYEHAEKQILLELHERLTVKNDE